MLNEMGLKEKKINYSDREQGRDEGSSRMQGETKNSTGEFPMWRSG